MWLRGSVLALGLAPDYPQAHAFTSKAGDGGKHRTLCVYVWPLSLFIQIMSSSVTDHLHTCVRILLLLWQMCHPSSALLTPGFCSNRWTNQNILHFSGLKSASANVKTAVGEDVHLSPLGQQQRSQPQLRKLLPSFVNWLCRFHTSARFNEH